MTDFIDISSPREVAGVIGFLLYVLNYSMLSLRRISGDSLLYFAINFCASGLVLLGLTANFNLAAALIQLFFIVMSTIAIVLRLFRMRRLGYREIMSPRRPRAARFRSGRHWADASPGTRSPDRVCG